MPLTVTDANVAVQPPDASVRPITPISQSNRGSSPHSYSARTEVGCCQEDLHFFGKTHYVSSCGYQKVKMSNRKLSHTNLPRHNCLPILEELDYDGIYLCGYLCDWVIKCRVNHIAGSFL